MKKLSDYASMIFAAAVAASPALAEENAPFKLPEIGAKETQQEHFKGLDRICNYYAREECVDAGFLKKRVLAYLELTESKGNTVTPRDIEFICRANSHDSKRFEDDIASGEKADGDCTIISFGGAATLGLELCNQGGKPVLNRYWDDETPQADARGRLAIMVDRALETKHDYEILTGQKPANTSEPRGYVQTFQHLLDGDFETAMQDGDCRSEMVEMSDGLDYKVNFCEKNNVLVGKSVTTPGGVKLILAP